MGAGVVLVDPSESELFLVSVLLVAWVTELV
jgi:hypothetical protein